MTPEAVSQPPTEQFSKESLAKVTHKHIDKCIAAGKVRPVITADDNNMVGIIFDDPLRSDDLGIFFMSYDGSVVARIGESTGDNPTRNETRTGLVAPFFVYREDPSNAATYIASTHGANCLLSSDEQIPQEDRLALAQKVAAALKEISASIDQENAQGTDVQKNYLPNSICKLIESIV